MLRTVFNPHAKIFSFHQFKTELHQKLISLLVVFITEHRLETIKTMALNPAFSFLQSYPDFCRLFLPFLKKPFEYPKEQ